MKAWSLIRSQPHYRREAFAAGLAACGYRVEHGAPRFDRPLCADDVLLIWNRYTPNHELALRFELNGGTVLVAENGYIGKGGSSPKFDVCRTGGPRGDDYYALAIGGHNGAGRWPVGGPERLAALDLALAPLRSGGEYVLVAPNRSFGMPHAIMPADWADRTRARLQDVQSLPVRVRQHPGNNAPARPLADDLAGAAGVVVWSSSVGVHALAAGIRVACVGPHWIAKPAASSDWLLDADDWQRRRQQAFERLAWAQWTLDEVQSGAPFRHLLRHARQAESAAAA